MGKIYKDVKILPSPLAVNRAKSEQVGEPFVVKNMKKAPKKSKAGKKKSATNGKSCLEATNMNNMAEAD